MNTYLRPISLGLIAAFGHPSSSSAQEALDPIVVTASRSPQLLEHATGETVVIGQKEIEARQVDRLTDIVNNTAGVFVATGKGALQTTQGFALRGIPSDRRTLVLIDGIPMTDGFSGSVLLGAIPTDSIRQAEILFGPMSSLYGGNAMGGVINFVTRMPTHTEFGFKLGYGDAFESGKAPADVQKAYIHAGTRLDNDLAIRFTGNWGQTNGYRSEWVTGTPSANSSGASRYSTELGAGTYLLGEKGDNTWKEHGASLKLEQRVSSDITWRAGWMLQDYHYGYATPQSYVHSNTTGLPIYGTSFAGGDSDYSRQIFHAGFDTKLGIGQLSVLASQTNVTTNSYIIATTGTAFGGPGRINESPSTSSILDSYWNASLGKHDITLGYAYRQDSAETKDYTLSNWTNPESKTSLYSSASGKTYLHGAYLQDNWQIAQRLTLQGGLRYDHWLNADGQSKDSSGNYSYAARTASAWSPKVGASWRVYDTLTLRTSAGKAFHAPTVYDLYRSSSLSTYNISANPNLEPETVKSWEAGADWRAWRGGEIRTTYFHNDIDNLIYLGPRQAVPGGKDVRLRINAGKARTDGVTLSLTHQFDVDNRVFANLTYTHSEMLENSASPSSVGKRLTGLPEKQASLGFETRRGVWTLSTSGRYASKQYADDTNADKALNVYKAYDAYFVVDTKLSYRFNKELNVSLAISNLFDRDYFSYYAAPGRAWFASLAYDY